MRTNAVNERVHSYTCKAGGPLVGTARVPSKSLLSPPTLVPGPGAYTFFSPAARDCIYSTMSSFFTSTCIAMGPVR